MKAKFIIFLSILFSAVFLNSLQAQDTTKTKDKKTEHSQFFVDEDGDGYNDNAPDHDGDGIPNGLDPDWLKLKKEEKKKAKRRFVDLDGDGIDDNLQMGQPGKQQLKGEFNKSGTSMEGKSKNQKGHGQKKRGNK